MVQDIPLIIGGAFVALILAGFFRSFWPSRKRRGEHARAGDWDNNQLPENIMGASGGNPPDFGGHGGGHHAP